MARLERRLRMQQIHSDDDVNTIQQAVRLYKISRVDDIKPKFRAQNAFIAFGSVETTSRAIAVPLFNCTEITSFYVLDFDSIKEELISEESVTGASRLAKPVIRTLTKLNPVEATFLLTKDTCMLGVKLLTSAIVREKTNNIVFCNPCWPSRSQWIQRNLSCPHIKILVSYSDEEQRVKTSEKVSAIFQDMTYRQSSMKDLMDPATIEWIKDNVSIGEYEYVEDADAIYLNEIIFYLSKYTKQTEQRIIQRGKETLTGEKGEEDQTE